MPFSQLIPSFNAGELSPYLDARPDIEKYGSGCRTLENMIVMPYGGAYRRPGTEYLGAAKHSDKRCRLLGFNFSTTTNFMLEAGDLYLRFWKNGASVEDPVSPGNPLEIVTPYLEADLRDIQFIQINDVMFFAHPSYAPRKLSRLADNSWRIEELIPDWPALLDENITKITLTASATTGDAITITATAPAWAGSTDYLAGEYVSNSGSIYKAETDHTSGTFATDLAAAKWTLHTEFTAASVGSYYQIGHDRDTASIGKTIVANGSSSTIAVLGDWELTTYGTWTASVTLERSYDGGTTWATVRGPYVSKNDRNISATGTEESEALLRLTVTNYVSNTSARALLELKNSREYGFVKISAVASATSCTAAVKNSLTKTTATSFWSEGAWSGRQGYPRTVSLHEQRVYYAGTSTRPQSIWGSNTDDFQNFRTSANDDAGLFFSLSSQEANPIQWMTSQDQLLIGTAGDEWTLGSTTADTPITPSNVRAARQSSYGSKYLRAMVVNDVILFVQRQGRKIRELVYQFEKDGWVAPDLTVLAEHVTSGEILESAFQQQPDALYWMVAGSGELVGMTYERDQNVVGFHRHTTDGTFESVATIYGASGPDEVWFSVNRTINGSVVRYIERFRTDFREQFENENKPYWWYLDCAKRVTNDPASVSVSGLTHLEAKEVDILADGAVSPARTVASGAITLQAAAGIVLAGLRFTSTLQPMKMEMQLRSGSTKGSKKKVYRAAVSLHKSLGGEYQGNAAGSAWDWMFSRTTHDPMDSSPPVFTGDKEFPVTGNHSRAAVIALRQTQPLPLTVLAITPQWEATGI